MLLVLCLAAPGSLRAEDEPAFREATQEIQQRIERLQRLLLERQKLLERQLRLLEELTEGGWTLARSASETGRSAAQKAIENARAVAEEEPVLGDTLLLALDRLELTLERGGFGEAASLRARRFLAELLPLERETNREIQRLVDDAAILRGLGSGPAFVGGMAVNQGNRLLERLFAVHLRTLDVREQAEPGG